MFRPTSYLLPGALLVWASEKIFYLGGCLINSSVNTIKTVRELASTSASEFLITAAVSIVL